MVDKMYKFKTDLMENQNRDNAFRRLGRAIGWVYDKTLGRLIGPNGHSIGRTDDGYWQHYHNNSPTNVKHHDISGFLNMLKSLFGFESK